MHVFWSASFDVLNLKLPESGRRFSKQQTHRWGRASKRDLSWFLLPPSAQDGHERVLPRPQVLGGPNRSDPATKFLVTYSERSVNRQYATPRPQPDARRRFADSFLTVFFDRIGMRIALHQGPAQPGPASALTRSRHLLARPVWRVSDPGMLQARPSTSPAMMRIIVGVSDSEPENPFIPYERRRLLAEVCMGATDPVVSEEKRIK